MNRLALGVLALTALASFASPVADRLLSVALVAVVALAVAGWLVRHALAEIALSRECARAVEVADPAEVTQ